MFNHFSGKNNDENEFRTDTKGGKFTGIWKGEEVSFYKNFGGHYLTNKQCQALCDSKETVVYNLVSNITGKRCAAKIALEYKTGQDGNKYCTVVKTEWGQQPIEQELVDARYIEIIPIDKAHEIMSRSLQKYDSLPEKQKSSAFYDFEKWTKTNIISDYLIMREEPVSINASDLIETGEKILHKKSLGADNQKCLADFDLELRKFPVAWKYIDFYPFEKERRDTKKYSKHLFRKTVICEIDFNFVTNISISDNCISLDYFGYHYYIPNEKYSVEDKKLLTEGKPVIANRNDRVAEIYLTERSGKLALSEKTDDILVLSKADIKEFTERTTAVSLENRIKLLEQENEALKCRCSELEEKLNKIKSIL